MIYVLSCGHQFQSGADDIDLGDRLLCDQCPETIRTNESRTASWSVGKSISYVVAWRKS